MRGRRGAVLVAGILLGLLGLASARSTFHPQPIEDGTAHLVHENRGATPRKMMADGSFIPGFWDPSRPGKLGNFYPKWNGVAFRDPNPSDTNPSKATPSEALPQEVDKMWKPLSRGDDLYDTLVSAATDYADEVVTTRPDLVQAMYGFNPELRKLPYVEDAWYQDSKMDQNTVRNQKTKVKLTLTYFESVSGDAQDPQTLMVVLDDSKVPQYLEYDGKQYTPLSEDSDKVGMRARNHNNKNDKWNTIRVGDKLWDKYAFGGGDFADTVLSSRPDLIKAMYGSDPQIRPSPVVAQASYQNQAKNVVLVKLKLIYTSGITDRDLTPQEVKILFANDVPQWLDFKGEQYSPMLRAPGGISGDNGQNANNGQNSNNGQKGNDQWITLDRSHQLWNMAEQAGQFAVLVLNNMPNLQRNAVNGDGRGVRYESLDLAKVQLIDGSPTIEFRITIIISLRDWQGNFGRQTVRTRVLYAGGNFQWAEWARDQFSL